MSITADNSKYIDKQKDIIAWIDLVGYVYYLAGNFNENIPVEWGRERARKLLKRFGKEPKNV